MGDISYPDEFVDLLEITWGDGFLSPGGPAEVQEVLRDIELGGKAVLDIGCGVGGPSMVIAQDLGAAKVVAVDVEPQLIDRARTNVAKANLDDRIQLKLIEPGALPFEEGSFDVVFSKDALIHVEDKPAAFSEILRVLCPGGEFAASDWLAGERAEETPEFQHWLNTSTHRFVMQTAAQAKVSMTTAGFVAISLRDRNAWYADLAAREVGLMEGSLRPRLLEVCDAKLYQRLLAIRQANLAAARSGALRPTHLRGAKRT